MFKKMQSLTKSSKARKLFAVCACMLVLGSTFITSAFAADEAQMTAQEAATTIFSTITEQINVGTIVGVIGIALGAGLGLYFAWWGIRKVSVMVRKGLNGKSPM